LRRDESSSPGCVVIELDHHCGGLNRRYQPAGGTARAGDAGEQCQPRLAARLATFLYSLAVQQQQATSFVTDTYNLDMQWLNTVDQPLLDEGIYWTERAATEGNTEGAILNRTQGGLALQVAAAAPGSRHDLSVTIHNAKTGNPTQITVFAAGDGSAIHDVAPSVFGYIESAISTVVAIAAVVTGQYYLYLAAAAIDAAEAGQAFSNGRTCRG